ncbi:unnamed protein product, partial [Didymodactylos carnosus]
LNKAFRKNTIDVLHKFRFYIIDLSMTLQCECKELKKSLSEKNIITVYRGQF